MQTLIEESEMVQINQVTEKIIKAAIEVHRTLGPGLLESVYEACLYYELQQAKLKVVRQLEVPLIYKGIKLDCGYRLDLLVEDKVIVEVKAVKELAAIHEVQIFSYLKLTGCKVGLVINFHVEKLVQGISRVINGY